MEEFQYHAKIPKNNINNIDSWISDIYHLEDWLNNHIGNHMKDWKYIEGSTPISIGFNKPEHKTFFLVAYNK